MSVLASNFCDYAKVSARARTVREFEKSVVWCFPRESLHAAGRAAILKLGEGFCRESEGAKSKDEG